ncbi:hypothetical protein [Streptomyces sp. MMBL 11-1]|uniref:hypothetical protein n=1 Tax=Streptomyces sp. MMBL 11-1 TaxID=3026420 RepID=UPI00235DF05C|nr:hypothetical protein [Streptomyces sp. MMBL 11-1]
MRPGEFAANALLLWRPSIRSDRRVVEPLPARTGNPIHEQDIADVIVAGLSPGSGGAHGDGVRDRSDHEGRPAS